MGKAQPVVLPSISFSTKKKATEFFKDMLNRYEDGQEIETSDHIFLYELLLRHPEATHKIVGTGVKKFFRQKSPDHPTSCFHLERIDNSKTDFSYPECISSFEPTLEQYFYRACRQSVSEILTAKKNQLFDRGNVRCSKTNELVSKENSEYRHTEPKFFEIVRQFKKGLNRPINNTMFVQSKDLQYSTRFSDKNIEAKFIEFHQKIANLAIFKKYER